MTDRELPSRAAPTAPKMEFAHGWPIGDEGLPDDLGVCSCGVMIWVDRSHGYQIRDEETHELHSCAPRPTEPTSDEPDWKAKYIEVALKESTFEKQLREAVRREGDLHSEVAALRSQLGEARENFRQAEESRVTNARLYERALEDARKLAAQLGEARRDADRWQAVRKTLRACSTGPRSSYYFTTDEFMDNDGAPPSADEYADVCAARAARAEEGRQA